MIDSWENIYFNENELPDICKLFNNFVEVFMKVYIIRKVMFSFYNYCLEVMLI